MSDIRLLSGFETMDYTPETIKESLDKHGKIVLKGILQKADTLNQNGRVYPGDILEREIRNYQKFILERRALGECVPPGTEIYTRDGWKCIENISIDEVVATLDVRTNELQFQRINKKVVLDHDGKMLRFKNAGTFDMCVTPNHRMLVWDRNDEPKTVLAQDLHDALHGNKDLRWLSKANLKRAGASWVGEEPETVTVGSTSVDAALWAAFLGIYLAEGCADGVKRGFSVSNMVQITQKDPETVVLIRDLLTKLPWSFKEYTRANGMTIDFKIRDKDLHSHLATLGHSGEKYVPQYAKMWSPKLLQVLLDWMLLGDGRHRHDYKGELINEYCTSSPRLAADVYDVMLKLGTGATHHVFEPKTREAPDFNETGRMILSENLRPMHIVSQSTSRSMSLDFRFLQCEVTDYVGKVYCVNVANGTWLMRYNGKVCWTHNCDHPDTSVINLKNVSHIITDAHIENGVVYGTVEVLDKTPSGAILKGLIESGVKLGISSRGVGSTKKQGDYHIVQDDYQLICFDVVSEPSTPSAFLIPEGKQISPDELKKVFNRSDRIDRVLNDILNGK